MLGSFRSESTQLTHPPNPDFLAIRRGDALYAYRAFRRKIDEAVLSMVSGLIMPVFRTLSAALYDGLTALLLPATLDRSRRVSTSVVLRVLINNTCSCRKAPCQNDYMSGKARELI